MRDGFPKELIPARNRFIDLIIERVTSIEALRVDTNRGGDPHAALLGIFAEVHKIAGVAASVGFSDIGAQAAALEQDFQSGIKNKFPLDVIWRNIDPRLVELMDALEALLDA